MGPELLPGLGLLPEDPAEQSAETRTGSTPAGAAPRVLALHLPDFSLQRLRRGRGPADRSAARERDPAALAVVHEGRVVSCDPVARAQGVIPGDSAVQAEAVCAGLQLLPLDAAADQAALEALAEALLQLAPAVELVGPDTLLLDASGARVLAPRTRPEEGELLLVSRSVALAAELGYRCRAALASGRGPARALARHGRHELNGAPVAPEATAVALAPLPLSAFPEIPEELQARLASLGIADVGSLGRLPPETLAHRFGLFAGVLTRLWRGEDRTPLVPYRPERLPREAFELEAPVESAEPLLFALKRVADRAAARLAGRSLGATRLELALRLDPRGEARVVIPLSRPSAAATRWMLVLREQIFTLRLEAPVAGLMLSVAEAVPAPQEQLALGDRPEELRALEVALSRLSARLGDGALCAAEPLERHRPEAAYRTAAFPGRGRRRGATAEPRVAPEVKKRRRPRTAEVAGPASPPLAELCRPTRLLPAPIPLVALGEGGRIAAVRCQGRTCRVLSFSRPERIAGEWWSEPFDRDYHRAVVEGLGECWIYRDGADGRLWLHGFFD